MADIVSSGICESLTAKKRGHLQILAASQSSRRAAAFNEINRNRVSGVFRARHTGHGCTATRRVFHPSIFGGRFE